MGNFHSRLQDASTGPRSGCSGVEPPQTSPSRAGGRSWMPIGLGPEILAGVGCAPVLAALMLALRACRARAWRAVCPQLGTCASAGAKFLQAKGNANPQWSLSPGRTQPPDRHSPEARSAGSRRMHAVKERARPGEGRRAGLRGPGAPPVRNQRSRSLRATPRANSAKGTKPIRPIRETTSTSANANGTLARSGCSRR